MPYSSAIRAASEAAAYALDKPMLIGANRARTLAAASQWRTSGSWASGADGTAGSGDTSRASDDYDHLRTFPASSETEWFYLLNLGAAPGTVDSLAILNPYGLSGVQIDLQLADNSAYSTNLVTVASVTPSDIKRVIVLDLHHTGDVPLRYSSAQWWRLRFTKGGAAILPRFGEVVLGNSLQLSHKPDRPYYDGTTRSSAERFESYSGVVTDAVRHRGRRHLSATLALTAQAEADAVRSFFEDDIDAGTRPFLWVDDPLTLPGRAAWMRMGEEPSLDIIRESHGLWVWRLSAIECGPNFVARGV
jgi:hypothetical protein